MTEKLDDDILSSRTYEGVMQMYSQQIGLLNDIQVKRAMADDKIAICPFRQENLTPIGYNLSYSRFIVSYSSYGIH